MPGSLDPFQPLTTYRGAFELARSLLLAGVGSPEDWAECHENPVNFMLRTVKRAASGVDQRAIDAVAHTNVVFGTAPSPSSWREPEPNPNRAFLAVQATHISIVYLRKTLELLGRADPRLPATFYRMLLQAVSSWILCYDESATQAYIDYRMEDYEELKASGEDEEGLEMPQTLEDAKGPWLAPLFKPWSSRRLPEVLSAVRRGARARQIMEATVGLAALARKHKLKPPDWKVWEECFPNGSYTVPFTILAFHEQDIVCQAFQSDEESWMQSGEDPSPAFFVVIDPADPGSVKAAFDELRHFISMLEALGKLFALVPGADLLEVQD